MPFTPIIEMILGEEDPFSGAADPLVPLFRFFNWAVDVLTSTVALL